jgi:hypothetical protein
VKIDRLKRGYRIRLSDSEFAALEDLAIRGEGELEGMEDWERKAIDRDVRRGLATITGQGSWALASDRRGK